VPLFCETVKDPLATIPAQARPRLYLPTGAGFARFAKGCAGG
jgi:hypothetical protein